MITNEFPKMSSGIVDRLLRDNCRADFSNCSYEYKTRVANNILTNAIFSEHSKYKYFTIPLDVSGAPIHQYHELWAFSKEDYRWHKLTKFLSVDLRKNAFDKNITEQEGIARLPTDVPMLVENWIRKNGIIPETTLVLAQWLDRESMTVYMAYVDLDGTVLSKYMVPYGEKLFDTEMNASFIMPYYCRYKTYLVNKDFDFN